MSLTIYARDKPRRDPATLKMSDGSGPPPPAAAVAIPTLILMDPIKENASLLTKASRLKAALFDWKKAGFPKTPSAVRKQRRGICDACQYFKPSGNLGLGECQAPGCGCTRAKLWMANQRCPLGYWEAFTPAPQ